MDGRRSYNAIDSVSLHGSYAKDSRPRQMNIPASWYLPAWAVLLPDIT